MEYIHYETNKQIQLIMKENTANNSFLPKEVGLMSRGFANSPVDRGSIPKTQKMVLDDALLNT